MEQISEEYLGDPAMLGHLLTITVIILVALIAFKLLKKGLDLLVHKFHLPQPALVPLQLIVRYGVFILTLIMILAELGISINAIVVFITTAFAMVAIGFVAVWSVLSNFFSTFIIMIFRPFSMGDEIEFPGDGVKGTVRSIGVYYTTLLDENDATAYQIPNNIFFQKILKKRYKSLSAAKSENKEEAELSG